MICLYPPFPQHSAHSYRHLPTFYVGAGVHSQVLILYSSSRLHSPWCALSKPTVTHTNQHLHHSCSCNYSGVIILQIGEIFQSLVGFNEYLLGVISPSGPTQCWSLSGVS